MYGTTLGPRSTHTRCTYTQTYTTQIHILDIHIHTHTKQTHTPRHTQQLQHIYTHAPFPASSPQRGSKAWHLQSCSSSVHRWKVMWGLGRGMPGCRSWRESPEGRSRLWGPRRGLWILLCPPYAPQHLWGPRGGVHGLSRSYIWSSLSSSQSPLAHPGMNTAADPFLPKNAYRLPVSLPTS